MSNINTMFILQKTPEPLENTEIYAAEKSAAFFIYLFILERIPKEKGM